MFHECRPEIENVYSSVSYINPIIAQVPNGHCPVDDTNCYRVRDDANSDGGDDSDAALDRRQEEV